MFVCLACSILLFVLKVILCCCNNYLLQFGDALVFDGFCFTLHTACGRCCFLFFFLFLIIKQRNNWCVITIFKDFHLKTVNLFRASRRFESIVNANAWPTKGRFFFDKEEHEWDMILLSQSMKHSVEPLGLICRGSWKQHNVVQLKNWG